MILFSIMQFAKYWLIVCFIYLIFPYPDFRIKSHAGLLFWIITYPKFHYFISQL